MAGEALANAAQSRTRFGVLLKALASEHEHLWIQTQTLLERSAAEAGDIPVDNDAKDDQDVLSKFPSTRTASTPPRSPVSHYASVTNGLANRENGEVLQRDSSRLRLSFQAPEWIEAADGPASQPSCKTVAASSCKTITGSSQHSLHVLEDDAPILRETSSHSACDPSETWRMASAAVLIRLQLRLGVQDWNGMLTASQVHTAVTCLGLERYNVWDMEKLILRMVRTSSTSETPANQCDPETAPAPKQIFLKRATSAFSGSTLFGEEVPRHKIPVMLFAEYLISASLGKKLGKDFEDMLSVLREILIAGDANRLVAELTSVRIDDLAAPPPEMDWDMFFEPFIGFIILLNGIAIGLQTERRWEDWAGWAWVESFFALFYACELCARVWSTSFCQYYCGHDAFWSFFDTFIVICAIVDTAFELIFKEFAFNMTAFTIIRIIRLTRLTRLFRLFRLGFLKELTIMVRGLIAGFKTLIWANVLLLFTIYIIAVFATTTVGKSDSNPEITDDKLFTTVPRSMLTSFRCFVGDCNTARGQPIIKILSDIHGVPFVLGYLASFTMVTLGLFNLITALYVEIAMAAAKRSEEYDKNRAHRESLRVAHITKNLLKKFCAAQRHIKDPRRMSLREVTRTLQDKSDVQDIDESQTISNELFLLIIQDQEVQRLMNDLDIPPDRANLFDVLDADGTGDLHVTELVQGLLKVRGEARKSDMIASLLAVRAVQDMIRLLENKMIEGHAKIMDHFGISWVNSDLYNRSIWSLSSQKAERITLPPSSHGSGLEKHSKSDLMTHSMSLQGSGLDRGKLIATANKDGTPVLLL